MSFTSPIDLSPQTHHSRYGLVRQNAIPSWVLGYEECLPTYRIDRPDGYPFPILELIVHGSGTATVRGRTFPLHSGTVFSYGPGSPVSFEAQGEAMTKYFLTSLQGKAWCESWFARILPGEPRVVPGVTTASALFEAILSPGNGVGTDQDEAARSLLEGLGAWLLSAGRTPGQAGRPDLLERASEVLEAEFRTLQSVSEWAERLEVSASHLCRLFKQHHHRTPYAELIDRKLQYAYRRLSQTSLRIQDIAREVGYEDPFHFSRLFKRRMGFPPSQLR